MAVRDYWQPTKWRCRTTCSRAPDPAAGQDRSEDAGGGHISETGELKTCMPQCREDKKRGSALAHWIPAVVAPSAVIAESFQMS